MRRITTAYIRKRIKSEPYTKGRICSAHIRPYSQANQKPLWIHSLVEVALGPALEPDLAEGERQEQPKVPRHQPQPERRVERRRRGEVGELLADAGEEEPREAVAVDRRDARRRDPPDQPEPDHVQVPPKPVPRKRHAGDPAVPLQVPRHQRVPRRHPGARREAGGEGRPAGEGGAGEAGDGGGGHGS